MGNKLYVGNISFKSSEQDLEELFGQHGTVKSVKIITDRETGRSRGFGFVEMENDEEAQAVIQNLDGQDVGGRPIRINEAREREERGGRGGFNR